MRSTRRAKAASRLSEDSAETCSAVMEQLAEIWEQPDYGIWEVRGPPRHFTYSKIMAWVAFDRAIKDAQLYGLDAPRR